MLRGLLRGSGKRIAYLNTYNYKDALKAATVLQLLSAP